MRLACPCTSESTGCLVPLQLNLQKVAALSLHTLQPLAHTSRRGSTTQIIAHKSRVQVLYKRGVVCAGGGSVRQSRLCGGQHGCHPRRAAQLRWRCRTHGDMLPPACHSSQPFLRCALPTVFRVPHAPMALRFVVGSKCGRGTMSRVYLFQLEMTCTQWQALHVRVRTAETQL